MTRNQKIALGCGGAGCLGLIFIVIAGGLGYYFWARPAMTRTSRDYNYNYNINLNSNSNDNTNSNSADDFNSNSDSNSNSSAPSTLSEDDKHKLFYAATVTGDAELIRRVNVKLGLLNDDFTPGDKMQDFIIAHAAWAFRNRDFIGEINTAEKARTYVNENFPE